MLVSEIGEFTLIDLLARECGVSFGPGMGVPPRPGLLVDIGDDAAVSAPRHSAALWTTDCLVAGQHFLPDKTCWRDVGWKALTVNLSDIAAMGGEPNLALAGLLLPSDFSVEDVVETYRGIQDAAQAFGVTVAGGNVSRAPVFAISIALSGWALTSSLGQPRLLRRNGARLGDLLAVTGTFGDSAAGLELARSSAVAQTGPDAFLKQRYDRPEPRVTIGKLAVDLGLRCAIDISDGLVQDLGHVARASGVALRLDANRVPVSEALTSRFPARALGLALTGGGDYELALIAPPPAMEALLQAQTEVALTVIGEVVAGDPHVAVIDERGQEIPLGSQGWDHFKTP